MFVIGLVPAELFSEVDLDSLFNLKARAESLIVDGDLAYTYSGTEAVIADYNSSATGTVEIPSSISGYSVTAIDTNAFLNCSDILVIKISDSVNSIGDYAFKNCTSLKKVIIPESVTSISSNAFDGCSDFVIACVEDSYIHGYCFDNGFDYTFTSSPIEYKIANSTSYNNHTYALYDVETNWKDAKAACEMLGGHLVVITSSAENTAVVELAESGSMAKGYLFGASDEETEGTWKWVTGESFSYSNWGSSEPSGGSENYLEYYLPKSYWNDTTISSDSRGFICEFEDNGIPYATTIYNGHIYSVYNDSLSWTNAEAFCENLGGHLVTITSEEEQTMVSNLINGGLKNLYWIGMSDAETEGTWKWVTGETVSYTNWGGSEPSGSSTSEQDYVQMFSTDRSSTKPVGTWNDDFNTGNPDSEDQYYRLANVGFICEVDTAELNPVARAYLGNNLYEIYDDGLTWNDSKVYSKYIGGHLVVINSAEEDSFVSELITLGAATNGYWFGASDAETEGVWETVTQESFLYTNWGADEPSNGSYGAEDYLEYYLTKSAWNDAKNSAPGRGFIVEYENHHEDLTLLEEDGSVIGVYSVQGNNPIEIPTETLKKGYETNWYVDSSLTTSWNFDDVIIQDTVLYAERIPNKYTVNFNYNGASGTITKKIVTYDSKYSSLPKPIHEGYTFGGWFTSDDKEITYSMIVDLDSDITVYAKWIPNDYTVDFELNGGVTGIENEKFDSITVSFDSEYGNLPTSSKEGYRFAGWKLNDGTAVYSDSLVATASDHTLYASWVESQILFVEIGSLPDKTEYVLGDVLDTDRLVLNVTYDNGEMVKVTDGYTCNPSILESSGVCAVTVNYEGFETEFEVNVAKGLPSKISVNSSPDKTEYLVGDTLNTDGLTLLAEYVDGSKEIISEGFKCSVSVFSKTGTQKITVTYGECETTFNVTIVNGDPIGVTIQTLPNKLQYTVGEELDITGLVLKVEYPNSVYKSVTDGFETTCDLNSIGTKTVNVTYTENGVTHPTSFTVEVVDADIATVWASSAFANASEAVSIPVRIMSNQGFMGFSFVLEYDETVFSPVSVTAGEMLSGGTINDSVGGSMSNGKLMVTYYTDENICVDGTLFTVNFAVNESASPGKYSLGISYIQKDTYNENYEDVKLTCTGGVVSVSNAVEDSKLNFCSDSVIVNAGEVLSFPIYVGNANELTDFTLTLNYNNSIFGFKEIQSEFVDEVIDNGDGTITFICNNASINTDNLLVLVADFKVEEYVEAQETIDISCSSATVSGTTVEANCTNAEITIINPYADEPAIIYTDEKVLVSDEYVNVPVYINNNHGIMGFQLNVSYDSAVIEPFSVTKGTLISIGSFDNNIGNITDKIKIIWNNTENVTDNGLLFTLCFKVLTDEKLTSVPVEFSYSQPDTYNESWEDVELDISFSTIPVMYEYTAHFVADGVVVSTQKFTIETENLVEPEIPQKAGYIASWSYYEIKEEDLIINAKYYLPETIMLAKRTLKVDDKTRLLPSSNFKATSKAWSSSNTSVAVVDNYGNVTAVGEGKCTIKVICYGEDSFGNEIKASTKTQIVVNEKTETKDLKGKFREAFDEFFEVKLHDFLENLKKFMIVLFRYAY